MRQIALCSLFWIVLILSLPFLPSAKLILPLSMLVVGSAYAFPSLRAFAWGYMAAALVLALTLLQLESRQLDSRQISRDLRLQIKVTSVPQTHSYGQRFNAKVLSCLSCTDVFGPKTIQLSWYGKGSPVSAGETWELSSRLKPIRGLRNEGSFDGAKWAIHKGLDARGYVRSKPAAEKLTANTLTSAASIRESLSLQLLELPSVNESAGLVQALVLGVKHGVEQQTWSVLRQTGTSHLLAISGLHISLLAGWAYFLACHSLPRVLRILSRVWPAVAAVESSALALFISVLCAGIYALLAGFELPVQRALIMLFVWAIAAWRLRHLAPAWGLALAVLMILATHMLSVLSPGFWLSFGTVALLFYLHRGRMQHEEIVSPESSKNLIKRLNAWRISSMLQSHVILGIALLPVTAWFFQAGSLVAPLANFLAVPFVGMVVVPLSFLSVLLSGLWPAFADIALMLAQHALEILFRYLTWLSQWDDSSISLAVPGSVVMLFCLVGITVLLLPRGTGLRWFAIPLLAPVLMFNTKTAPVQGFEVHVLDVGQGHASLVFTDTKTLLFDTGGKVSPSLSMFESAVMPYLHAKGRRTIDHLIVSHSDEDHTFGLPDFVSRFPDADITMGGDLQKALIPVGEPCYAGQSWQHDGVSFSFLHPAADDDDGDNNGSCVLLVHYGASRALLTGDIEKKGESKIEHRLATANAATAPTAATTSTQSKSKAIFPVDLLIAPHHGSKTSSGTSFLSKLRPEHVVFTAGFLNRYGFPHGDVQMRYKLLGAKQFITGKHGSVAFSFGRGGLLQPPVTWLQTHRRFWHGFVNPTCSEKFSDKSLVFKQILLAQKGQTLCGK